MSGNLAQLIDALEAARDDEPRMVARLWEVIDSLQNGGEEGRSAAAWLGRHQHLILKGGGLALAQNAVGRAATPSMIASAAGAWLRHKGRQGVLLPVRPLRPLPTALKRELYASAAQTPPHAAGFHPSTDTLAVTTRYEGLWLWSVSRGVLRARQSEPARREEHFVKATAEEFVVVSGNGVVEKIDPVSGKALGRPLDCAASKVTAVAVDAVRRRVFIAGEKGPGSVPDGEIVVVDLASMKVVTRRVVQSTKVVSLTIDTAGETLVSTHWGGRVLLLAASDLSQVRTVRDGRTGYEFQTCGFLEDGTLMGIDRGRALHVLDPQSGDARETHQLPHWPLRWSTAPARVVGEDANGILLATGYGLERFDRGSGRLDLLIASSDINQVVRTAPDEVVTVTRDSVRVWDLLALEPLGAGAEEREGHGSGVEAIACGGSYGASLSDSPELIVWDLNGFKEIERVAGKSEDTHKGIAVDPATGSVLSWASYDKSITRWPSKRQRPAMKRARLTKVHKEVTAACFLDGGRAVSAGMDGELALWDLQAGKVIKTATGAGGVYDGGWNLRPMVVSAAPQAVLTGSREGLIQVWSWDLELLRILEGHQDYVEVLVCGGRRAISKGHDRALRIWAVDSGECLHTIEGFPSQITTVAIDETASRFVTVANESPLLFQVWDLPRGAVTWTGRWPGSWTLPEPAFTPDLRYAFVVQRKKEIALGDLSTGAITSRWELDSEVQCLAVASPPGAAPAVAVGTRDGDVVFLRFGEEA